MLSCTCILLSFGSPKACWRFWYVPGQHSLVNKQCRGGQQRTLRRPSSRVQPCTQLLSLGAKRVDTVSPLRQYTGACAMLCQCNNRVNTKEPGVRFRQPTSLSPRSTAATGTAEQSPRIRAEQWSGKPRWRGWEAKQRFLAPDAYASFLPETTPHTRTGAPVERPYPHL